MSLNQCFTEASSNNTPLLWPFFPVKLPDTTVWGHVWFIGSTALPETSCTPPEPEYDTHQPQPNHLNQNFIFKGLTQMKFALIKSAAVSVALIVAAGSASACGLATVNQFGWGQGAGVTQLGACNNTAVSQTGWGNQATAYTDGFGNVTAIGQEGAFNNAASSQFGVGNDASVNSFGNFNTGGVIQVGNGQSGHINQAGSGNTALIIQAN